MFWVILILLFLYLLALQGRTGHPGMEELRRWNYAHRGLHGNGLPENSMAAFREVLELFGGKAPMIVELKPVGGNHAALAAEACRQLDNYAGAYCIESFDPRCLFWLKKHRPQIIRGQLSMNFFRHPEGQPLPIQAALTCHLLNFLSRPDFIAYKFADRNRLGCFLCRKLWHIQGVSWTLRTPEDHAQARKEGWLSIFESFRA